MGLGHILGGIGVGIAAVVAAPVLGAVGAITVVGAAVGAGVGAVGGGLASEMAKEAHENTRKEGMTAARGEYEEALKSIKKKQNIMLHLYAIGVLAVHKKKFRDEYILNATKLEKMDSVIDLGGYLSGASGELDEAMKTAGQTKENDLIETFINEKDELLRTIRLNVKDEESLKKMASNLILNLNKLAGETKEMKD